MLSAGCLQAAFRRALLSLTSNDGYGLMVPVSAVFRLQRQIRPTQLVMRNAPLKGLLTMTLRSSCMLVAALAVAFVSVPQSYAAQVKEQTTLQLQPTTLPEMIWVTDFAIDTEAVKEDSGPMGGGPLKGSRVQRLNPLHHQESPEATARNLVERLAEGLVQDLQNSQLPTRRLSHGEPQPGKGWLINGRFLEVDEGNRLRRAVIGFGSGATEMQIEVEVTDLSSQPGSPFLVLGSTTGTGKAPGAVVTLNPYVAAAKFVLAKNATEKDVTSTAACIAAEIVKYMKTHGLLR